MKDIQDEIRKLKAIIVKHENRLRAVEAAQKAREQDEFDAIAVELSTKAAAPTLADGDATGHSGDNVSLAPDEVWNTTNATTYLSFYQFFF